VQDLTITVDGKGEFPGFSAWTVKQDQFGVQPPVEVLENIFTVRIHLDDRDEGNGALRVSADRTGMGQCGLNWQTAPEKWCAM
jgi:hypothetical protein